MSLLRTAARPPKARWVETWQTYPGTVDDAPAVVVGRPRRGRGRTAAAPARPLDIEAPYPAGPTGSAEPATWPSWRTPSARAVEALGGVYVGRVASRGVCRFTAHLPTRATRAGRAWPDRAGATCGPSTTRTGRTSATRSRPTTASTGCSQDLAVRRRCSPAEGDPLATPRAVAHVAVLRPTRSRPRRPRRDLRADGFAATVERDDEGDFALTALRSDPVAPPTRARADLGGAGDRRAPRRHLRRLELRRRRGLRSPRRGVRVERAPDSRARASRLGRLARRPGCIQADLGLMLTSGGRDHVEPAPSGLHQPSPSTATSGS